MKHKLSLIAVLLMALAIPQSVKAFSYTYQGKTLYYNIVNGEVQVTSQTGTYPSYTNLFGTLVIPSSVTYNNKTYSVTSIDVEAFLGCSGLTSVTIPNSVTSIGGNAFARCSGLTSVTIPNSLTSISGGVFAVCSGLTSVTIPNSVTTIGQGAFYYCSGLTSVTIPNSVTSIGNSAFACCSSLTSVTIPNSVTSIGDYTFYYCSGLTSVTIPNSVTSIGDSAFAYCSGLTSVVFNADSCTSYYNAFPADTNITIFTFGDNVKVIPPQLCKGMTGLTSVTIPNTVTSIGYSAFSGCSGLTSVTIPNSVTSIGYSAFSGCSGLTSVAIPNSVTSISGNAFSGCSGLISLTIPNSVTSIGLGAFNNCSGLTSVTIPNSVTSIGDHAFRDCSGLTSVTIPNSVIDIGFMAFSGCSSLTLVTIPNSVSYIGGSAFSGCIGLTSVIIPNSVTSISGNAFPSCGGLTSIIVESGNTYYDSRDNCNAIIETSTNALITGCQNTIIPNSVISIGDDAFANCSGLTSVTIPDSVISIGTRAFGNCIGLTEITCLGTIAPTLGNIVFYNVSSTIPVYIPCGSTASYQSNWNYFHYNFVEPSAPDIDLQPADLTMGTATITSWPTCVYPTAVFEATANYGYHFTQWNDGDTNNPRTVALTQDTSFTAYFSPNQYTLTVLSDNGNLGSVAGSSTYDYLDTVEISATAIEHYHFVQWSDGNRDNPRQVVITGNLSYTATFAIDTHNIAVTVNDMTRGTATGAGDYIYGAPCILTAIPYEGYTFAGWSNSVTSNPYAFQVVSDVELTAIFVAEGEEVYMVTVVSADPLMGSVSGGGQALGGGSVTIRATPNEGYRFLNWNDGNTENPRTVTVTGDITYTAYFESMTQGISDVNDNNITVYPNPTSSKVKVSADDVTRIDVYNVNGQLVNTVAQESVIDISSLPSGVYTMKVETVRSTFVCRVIKK